MLQTIRQRQLAKLTFVTAGLVLLLVGLVAGESLLASFMPDSGELDGWQVISGTDRGGVTDEQLYPIYDGAVPALREKGLHSAHQRIYKKGNQRITVDVYRFGNWQQAKGYFLPHRETQKDCGIYQLYNNIKQQAFVAEAAGSITGMFWQRNYLCAVGMQGSGTADRATVKSFLTFISNKIKKRYQKQK